MRHFKAGLAAAIALVGLSACATNVDVDGVAMAVGDTTSSEVREGRHEEFIVRFRVRSPRVIALTQSGHIDNKDDNGFDFEEGDLFFQTPYQPTAVFCDLYLPSNNLVESMLLVPRRLCLEDVNLDGRMDAVRWLYDHSTIDLHVNGGVLSSEGQVPVPGIGYVDAEQPEDTYDEYGVALRLSPYDRRWRLRLGPITNNGEDVRDTGAERLVPNREDLPVVLRLAGVHVEVLDHNGSTLRYRVLRTPPEGEMGRLGFSSGGY